MVHRLRDEHDAILVGINTILKDDPELTTRGIPNGRSPTRVILDSRGRLPAQAKCLREDAVPVFWFVGNEAALEFQPPTTVERIVAPSPIPEIPWILAQLEQRGVQSLLVEGGSNVHASFLRHAQIDRLLLFIAPKILGSEGISWCGPLGLDNLEEASRWRIRASRNLGEDILIEADFLGHPS
jgi:diaminohydroxyphosphoribosylaminopyrimidine deaminase/5-amino-6-(5-phosphoribosylamino)uracil reductase